MEPYGAELLLAATEITTDLVVGETLAVQLFRAPLFSAPVLWLFALPLGAWLVRKCCRTAAEPTPVVFVVDRWTRFADEDARRILRQNKAIRELWARWARIGNRIQHHRWEHQYRGRAPRRR